MRIYEFYQLSEEAKQAALKEVVCNLKKQGKKISKEAEAEIFTLLEEGFISDIYPDDSLLFDEDGDSI